MAKMLLLSFVLLWKGIWQVCGDRTTQPCDPNLCESLCQGKKDCSVKIFDEIQVSCRLMLQTHALNPRCQVSREGNVMQSKNITHSRKKSHSCSPSGLRRFHKACEQKNLEEVERLVGKGLLDVNCRFQKGGTPVMLTASYNWTRAFDYLVQQNCDLTARTPDLYSVLHYASAASEEIVRKLLDDHCIDIDCRESSGLTPLAEAAQTEHVRIAQLLIDRGADLKVVDKKNNTILHVASYNGNVNMVKYILSLNVIDIESKALFGRTPLVYATSQGHIPAFKELLLHNADVTKVDYNDCNVLHLAAIFGHLDMIKFLVSLEELSGFEKREDKRGRTPVQIAEEAGHSKIVSFLKSKTN